MFRLRRVAWLLWPALLPGQAGAPDQTPSFQADVRLVQVLATVKNTKGAVVGGLEREDFSVSVNGEPQQIAVFERQTDRPLSVALLFDASPSVAKESRFEREAAGRFVRSLLGRGAHPQDRIAVYKFSAWIDQIAGFTDSVARLEKALQSVQTESGTSVYDAVYLAAQDLQRRPGRRVLVLVTDGGDTTSVGGFHKAMEEAQRADAVVYSIIVVPITNDAGRNLGGENALKTLSASTGGVAFPQHTFGQPAPDMEDAFRQIERDLRTQYLIGFYPRGVARGPERFQRLDLRVRRPDLRVLARTGYFSGPDQETGAVEAPVRR